MGLSEIKIHKSQNMGRNCLDRDKIIQLGIIHKGIGR